MWATFLPTPPKDLVTLPGFESPATREVIGAANMDIAGRPDTSLVAGDSNPGKVTMSFGGVGRNVAHNLALLDSDVRLLTAFGEEYRARELKEGCLACGIDWAVGLGG